MKHSLHIQYRQTASLGRLLLILFLFFTAQFAPGQIPTIISFSPTSGPIGATVTITGTNFNTTAANNVVSFGAVKAAVANAGSASLTVTVPTGATFAPISVTNLTTALTAYSLAPFVVTFSSGVPITSSSFDPKLDFPTGSFPKGIAIADIDGDGKPDVVVSNGAIAPGSNTISVLRNTGSNGIISFASKVDFATTTNPWDVAVGDIDGDGKPERRGRERGWQ